MAAVIKTKEYVNFILKEIGWTSGHHVPIANEENKELEHKVERLLLARAEFTDQLDKLGNRKNELENHLKHLEHEANECDSLLASQKSQLATELENNKTAIHDDKKLKAEIRQFDKDVSDTKERQNRYQNDICRGLTRLNELKKSVTYDKEALDLWENALAKSQDDNSVIKKFSQKDLHKAQELELRRQKLQVELLQRRDTQAKVVSELFEMEANLEKCEDLYRNAKCQRAELLKQWREAVAHLRQRHTDMHMNDLEIEKLREAVKKKLQDIEEANTFYENEVQNNKELLKQCDETNKMVSRTLEDLRRVTCKVLEFQQEVNISKRLLATEASHVENARMLCKKYLTDLAEIQIKTQRLKNSNTDLQTKLAYSKSKSFTANERAKELEGMIQANEILANRLMAETSRLQGIVYRSQQHLMELQDLEASYNLEIKNMQKTIEHLTKREKVLDLEMNKKKESIYFIEYEIIQVEAKLDIILGTVKDDEDEEKTKRIYALDDIDREKTNIISTLTKQVNRIQDDIRRLGAQLNIDNSVVLRLQDNLQNESKMVDGGKRLVKASLLRSQDKQVEENLLRLRVTQAQKILDNIDNSLYTLEKHRLEMEQAMKERQIEVTAERDVLAIRKRALLEDKSKIRMELQERLLRIEQYKKRMELAVSLLGVDEDGNAMSPAYFKIKVAQEKQILQNEGDQWDGKIRKAEQEIVAMENTLTVINATNNQFRNCLDTIEDTGPEEAQLKQLQDDQFDLVKKARAVRVKHKQLKARQEETECKVKELTNKLYTTREKHYELENELKNLEKSLKDQEARLCRANFTLAKVMKHVRSTSRNVVYEKEIKSREVANLTRNGLNAIVELLIRHIEVQPTVTRLCDYYHVSLPPLDRWFTQPRSVSSVSSLGSVGMDIPEPGSSRTSSASTSFVLSKPVNRVQQKTTVQHLTLPISFDDPYLIATARKAC